MRITLDISDRDIGRFFTKTYGSGTTPEEVLAGFVADLISGEKSHGSDERDLANQYFDRCGYDYFPKTFTQWAVGAYRVEELADAFETIADADEELENLEEDGEAVADEIREEKAEAEEIVAGIFREYVTEKEEAGEAVSQEIGEAVEELRAYFSDMLEAMES